MTPVYEPAPTVRDRRPQVGCSPGDEQGHAPTMPAPRTWVSQPRADPVGRHVLVALHGRGADESSLAALAPDLPDELLVICPAGTIPEGATAGAPGLAWFEMHTIGYPVAASLARARSRLLRWLDAELAGARSLSLLGFSDGALLAGDLLVHEPHRFAAAVLLAGALPWSTDPPATDGRLTGVPVHFSYGGRDDICPTDLLERTGRWLVDRSGADVEVRVHAQLGHVVDTAQVEDARALLEQRVLRPARSIGPIARHPVRAG